MIREQDDRRDAYEDDEGRRRPLRGSHHGDKVEGRGLSSSVRQSETCLKVKTPPTIKALKQKYLI